jgi:hypothetical protein
MMSQWRSRNAEEDAASVASKIISDSQAEQDRISRYMRDAETGNSKTFDADDGAIEVKKVSRKHAQPKTQVVAQQKPKKKPHPEDSTPG